MFKNKCHNEIHNYRRTNCEKGEINKIHSNARRTNTEFASPPVTNTECALFKPVYDIVYEGDLGHGVIIDANLRKENHIGSVF